MDFDLGVRATELRGRLRSLIAAHVPEGYLGACTDDPADLEVAQRFCHTLAREGLLTVAWPTEYGGAGGSVWEQTVVREEMWAHHEPRGAQYMGLNWVGPVIMQHGTAEQRVDRQLCVLAEQVEAFGFGQSLQIPLPVTASTFPTDMDDAQTAMSSIGPKSMSAYSVANRTDTVSAGGKPAR